MFLHIWKENHVISYNTTCFKKYSMRSDFSTRQERQTDPFTISKSASHIALCKVIAHYSDSEGEKHTDQMRISRSVSNGPNINCIYEPRRLEGQIAADALYKGYLVFSRMSCSHRALPGEWASITVAVGAETSYLQIQPFLCFFVN